MIFKLFMQYWRAKIYGYILTYLFKELKKTKYTKWLNIAEYSAAIFEAFYSRNKPNKSFSNFRKKNRKI